MSENMKKVLELLKKNPELQEKVMAALKSLDAEADVEKLLNDVFAPIAKEAGVQLTAEDVKSFAENVSEDAPLSADDLADVNGGFLYGIFPLIGKVVQGITNVVNQMNKKPEPDDVKKKGTTR